VEKMGDKGRIRGEMPDKKRQWCVWDFFLYKIVSGGFEVAFDILVQLIWQIAY